MANCNKLVRQGLRTKKIKNGWLNRINALKYENG